MPLVRGGRLLKQWRYVGVYGADLMLCAGAARIGPTRQVWWAVWDRTTQRLHERTRQLVGRDRVTVARDAVRVRDDDVVIDLTLTEDGPGVEIVTPDPGGYAWTRKQGAAHVTGTVEIGGTEHRVDGAAIVDDSAVYHPHHVVALVGGRRLRCGGAGGRVNLVDGVHDPPHDSERTVWIAGRPAEVDPVRFADDLSSVAFAKGGS